ncbi:unnamed protein product [Polarella glacialis]|uniref:Uncharacterized protein n=1 Tax=Polarella glacialis TaxID=89957 RepID=A0A813JGZ4_POLGL|nr:unnamed protein product [Polarella glacialis]
MTSNGPVMSVRLSCRYAMRASLLLILCRNLACNFTSSLVCSAPVGAVPLAAPAGVGSAVARSTPNPQQPAAGTSAEHVYNRVIQHITALQYKFEVLCISDI